jgi:hypothetical protein
MGRTVDGRLAYLRSYPTSIAKYPITVGELVALGAWWRISPGC